MFSVAGREREAGVADEQHAWVRPAVGVAWTEQRRRPRVPFAIGVGGLLVATALVRPSVRCPERVADEAPVARVGVRGLGRGHRGALLKDAQPLGRALLVVEIGLVPCRRAGNRIARASRRNRGRRRQLRPLRAPPVSRPPAAPQPAVHGGPYKPRQATTLVHTGQPNSPVSSRPGSTRGRRRVLTWYSNYVRRSRAEGRGLGMRTTKLPLDPTATARPCGSFGYQVICSGLTPQADDPDPHLQYWGVVNSCTTQYGDQ